MNLWSRGAAAAEELASELLGVRKASSPLDPDGFLVISDRVAAALRTAAAGQEALVVQQVLAGLTMDWTKLSSEAVDRAVAAANSAISKHYTAMVLPKLDEVLEIEGPKTMRATKKGVIAREEIEIEPALTERDLAAEAAIRKSQVNFIRDEAGARSGRHTAAARDIVARGLSEGVGNKVIANDLRAHFGKTIPKPESYWYTVSSAFVGRARSTSQVYAYEDAGIETFEVVAMLDEVTTDQCRFMNGKVFTVKAARRLLDTLQELEAPEDVKYANPWIRVGKDSKGNRQLYIPRADGGATTIARVTRSGVGTADDVGSFSRGKSAASLSKLGVQFPPYHGRCRTLVVAGAEVSSEKPKLMLPGADFEPTPPEPQPEVETEGTDADVPKEHTPEHWLPEYKAFGEAASTLAYGRAAEERGLALPIREAAASFKQLRSKGVLEHGWTDDAMLDSLLEEDVKLSTVSDGVKYYERLAAKHGGGAGVIFTAKANELRATSALVAHAKSIKTADVKLPAPKLKMMTPEYEKLVQPTVDKAMKNTTSILSALASDTLKYPAAPDYTYQLHMKSDRGEFVRNKPELRLAGYIDLGSPTASAERMAQTALHETGHAMEELNRPLLTRSIAYVRQRTRGEGVVKLADVFPGHGYKPHEVTRQDKLNHAYMGKDYGDSATEITSMLLEQLNDRRRATQLYKDDPESFRFILGQLANQ